mgnify:FL=1
MIQKVFYLLHDFTLKGKMKPKEGAVFASIELALITAFFLWSIDILLDLIFNFSFRSHWEFVFTYHLDFLILVLLFMVLFVFFFFYKKIEHKYSFINNKEMKNCKKEEIIYLVSIMTFIIITFLLRIALPVNIK